MQLGAISWQKAARFGRDEIRTQKRGRYPSRPVIGPVLNRDGRVMHDERLRLAAQGGVRCIVKRSQHTGNISKCRGFDTPLTHWAFRLSFEVDDDKVRAREKHLSQM